MKFTWLHLTLAAIGGLVVGSLLSPAVRSSPREMDQTPVSKRQPSMRVDRREISQTTGLRRQMRTVPPRDLPKLAYKALEIADASERREAMLEAVRATSDPESCMEVIAQFERITRETGRDHAPLLSAALFEAGKLYGTAMLDSRGGNAAVPFNYLWETLYGVSFSNPASAKEWLDQADSQKRRLLISAVIGGTALQDPDHAAVMMAALPKEERMSSISNFAYNTIQKQGMDRAVDWMLEVTRSTSKDESDYVAEVENQIFGGLVAAARSNGGERELARHLERINRITPLSHTRLIRMVGALPGPQSLNLMDQLIRNPEFAQVPDLKAALLQAVPAGVSRSLDSIGGWLEQHPDSPLAPLVRENLDKGAKH